MDFYLLDQPYTSLGCYKDKNDRAFKGGNVRLGSRGGDPDPVTACYERAKELGNKFFAVQHGTACFANSNTADLTYNRYGAASNCAEDGTGGEWANSVYRIGIAQFYSN